jgi:hypothetical protein
MMGAMQKKKLFVGFPGFFHVTWMVLICYLTQTIAWAAPPPDPNKQDAALASPVLNLEKLFQNGDLFSIVATQLDPASLRALALTSGRLNKIIQRKSFHSVCRLSEALVQSSSPILAASEGDIEPISRNANSPLPKNIQQQLKNVLNQIANHPEDPSYYSKLGIKWIPLNQLFERVQKSNSITENQTNHLHRCLSPEFDNKISKLEQKHEKPREAGLPLQMLEEAGERFNEVLDHSPCTSCLVSQDAGTRCCGGLVVSGCIGGWTLCAIVAALLIGVIICGSSPESCVLKGYESFKPVEGNCTTQDGIEFRKVGGFEDEHCFYYVLYTAGGLAGVAALGSCFILAFHGIPWCIERISSSFKDRRSNKKAKAAKRIGSAFQYQRELEVLPIAEEVESIDLEAAKDAPQESAKEKERIELN